MPDDTIIYHNHKDGGLSVTFTGDAQYVYHALMLSAALKLYDRTKIRPNRHVTLTMMLRTATTYTGKEYSRKQAGLASQDLLKWAEIAKLSVSEEVR